MLQPPCSTLLHPPYCLLLYPFPCTLQPPTHTLPLPLQALPVDRATRERALLFWHLEDCLKRRYALFVTALEEASRDNLEFIKEKATKAISDLLSAKPEQEARLLSALVNKMGDPSRKIASKAGYLLSQLLLQHPAMKPVVVREVGGGMPGRMLAW